MTKVIIPVEFFEGWSDLWNFLKNTLKWWKHHLEGKWFDTEGGCVEKSITIMTVVNPLYIDRSIVIEKFTEHLQNSAYCQKYGPYLY